MSKTPCYIKHILNNTFYQYNGKKSIQAYTFITTVIENIECLHCSWPPLFIAKNQIYPFMKMSRNIFRLLVKNK